MSAEDQVYTALIERAEAITGYSVLWPQKGGDKPEGEHLTVQYLPNDSTAGDLSSNVYDRQGFLVVTLVSPLGQYEAPTRRKAGEIAAFFPRGACDVLTITGHTIKGGRRVEGRWETPIWIRYKGML